MTHDQFLQWIEEEMEKAKINSESPWDQKDTFYMGRFAVLREVKAKFEQLLPPPTQLN